MSFLKKFGLALSVATLLAACGGGAGQGASDSGDGDPGAPIDPTRTILMSVSGSTGPVNIRVNDQDIALEVGGSTQLEGFGQDDSVQATIISQEDGDNCYFSPMNQPQILVSNRATIECGSPRVTGTVKDFFTNAELADVNVVVSVSDGTTSTLLDDASTVTDSSGEFSVSADAGQRLIVTFSASGYAPYSRVVELTDERPSALENIFLVPRILSDDEDPSLDMVFRISGIPVLEVPANGLVIAAGGGSPVGNVTATLAILDPTISPSVLPGQYQYFESGLISRLETFGGLSVSLIDSEGNALELASGVDATLSVPSPLSSLENVDDAGFIYAFDDSTGYWVDEISAVESSFGSSKIFTATVSELSETYMAGASYIEGTVGGVVVDGLGNPFSGVLVIAQGDGYLGLSYGVTDEGGSFSLPAKAGEEVLVYALAGAQSRTAQATVGSSNGLEILLERDSTVITLTWGEDPSDLDSHLFGPTVNSSEQFHVLFSNPEVTVGGQTIFLDVDDTTSFGPEVTTIPSYPLPGTYSFYVFLFAGDSTIQASPARVELNLQGNGFSFSPPSGFPTRCWHVFDVDVDSSLAGRLVQRSNWVDESACSSPSPADDTGDGG